MKEEPVDIRDVYPINHTELISIAGEEFSPTHDKPIDLSTQVITFTPFIEPRSKVEPEAINNSVKTEVTTKLEPDSLGNTCPVVTRLPKFGTYRNHQTGHVPPTKRKSTGTVAPKPSYKRVKQSTYNDSVFNSVRNNQVVRSFQTGQATADDIPINKGLNVNFGWSARKRGRPRLSRTIAPLSQPVFHGYPYNCDFCDQSCVTLVSLATHLKNNHPTQSRKSLFRCGTCSVAFQLQSSLKFHFMSFHKESEASADSLVKITNDEVLT